jgi:hypothetical protein
MSKLTTNKRWLLWLPMLALAVWLGLFADKTPSDQRAPPKLEALVASKTTTQTHAAATTAVKIDSLVLDALIDRYQLFGLDETKSSTSRNLFVSSSWTPPPPPSKPSAPIVAPTPTAPAFPFQYVGKKLEDSVWEVYLSRGDQSFLVREGGTLESTYRIDSITSQRLTVTYLPLGQSQSLSIGESQ